MGQMIQTQTLEQHKNGSLSTNQASAMAIPVQTEALSWSCESKSSRVNLDEGMVSDLLSGVL